MKDSSSENSIKIVILASTRGTDIQAIADAISDGRLDARIEKIICNRECGALELARRNGVEPLLMVSKGKGREEYDREIAEQIGDADLILLIGYMRYLSPWFVERYDNRIMNIHPSLLPAFAGGMDKDVHQEVLDYGCKVTGCTLHFVDEGADTGPIIMQRCVAIAQDDTSDSLKKKVQMLEQDCLVEAIDLFSRGRISVEGRKVRIL